MCADPARRLRTRLSSKGQVVIPKPIRDDLRLRKRGVLEVWVEDGRIVLAPSPEDDWKALRGTLAGIDAIGDLERDHREEREREQARP